MKGRKIKMKTNQEECRELGMRDGWMDKWSEWNEIHGWMDGWMDGRIYI